MNRSFCEGCFLSRFVPALALFLLCCQWYPLAPAIPFLVFSASTGQNFLELSSIHNQGWEQRLRGYLRVLCGVLFLYMSGIFHKCFKTAMVVTGILPN